MNLSSVEFPYYEILFVNFSNNFLLLEILSIFKVIIWPFQLITCLTTNFFSSNKYDNMFSNTQKQ